MENTQVRRTGRSVSWENHTPSDGRISPPHTSHRVGICLPAICRLFLAPGECGQVHLLQIMPDRNLTNCWSPAPDRHSAPEVSLLWTHRGQKRGLWPNPAEISADSNLLILIQQTREVRTPLCSPIRGSGGDADGQKRTNGTCQARVPVTFLVVADAACMSCRAVTDPLLRREMGGCRDEARD